MISVRNINHHFQNLAVLSDISFEIEKEEILCIMGPSGCGKSTLLRILSGLITASDGKVEGVDGEISFVFQDDRLLPWMNTWQNISVVREKENKEKISSLIRDVGLQGFEKYRPSKLSGGMRKRCGIARAFYYEGKLLLMDEPFSGLDFYMRQEMLEMLLRVWDKRRQSVVFITHEVDEALKIADRILFLSNRPSKIIREYQLPSRNQPSLRKDYINKIRDDIMNLVLETKQPSPQSHQD